MSSTMPQMIMIEDAYTLDLCPHGTDKSKTHRALPTSAQHGCRIFDDTMNPQIECLLNKTCL